MKSVRFHDSKLKLVKASLFRLFHETEAPTAGFCSAFICGRAYWLRHCEFIRNLRANSVIRGKLQISRAKSVIHSECKYKQELRINN